MITRDNFIAWLIRLLMQHLLLANVSALVEVRALRPHHGHRLLPRATRRVDLASFPDPSESPPIAPSSTTSSSSRRPFRLEHIDHVVIRCRNFPVMFDFYHRVLGCAIDEPRDDHVNRFGGALTHLRAGSCFIDLMAYDTAHLTEEGCEAVVRMHAGGEGLDSGKRIADVNMSPATSTLDHLCLRIDPFDKQRLLDYFDEENVDIIKRSTAGDARLGADGVGPSVYLRDPEGNVVELKGSPIRDSDIESVQVEKPSRMPNERVQKSRPNNKTATAKNSNKSGVPVSPCIRICRYNSAFYDGQVCIGCFREAYEIGMWQSMTSQQKSMTLVDAIDRCLDGADDDCSMGEIFDGAITIEELKQQFVYWSDLADSK